MSLLSFLKGKGPSGFGYGSTAEEVTEGLDLSGRTFLLTGCNSGLGLETMRVLSLRGAHLLALARTQEKAQAAIESVSARATPFACELSEPASVRECVAAIRQHNQPLDAMICNAGIMALPKLQQKYGYELQFFTNHIGHFLLVTGLLDQLTEEGRVVMLSSEGHRYAPPEGIQFENLSGERGYSAWRHYGQSKLANLLFARELSRRLAETKQSANAVHPGVIRTNLGRHMSALARGMMAVGGPLFLKTPEQGAATQCYVATHPDVATVSGHYFADCNQAKPSKHAEDEQLAARLWQVSEEIVAHLEKKEAAA